MVARESGTISGTLPESVIDQNGRLLKVVYWVREAWRRLQNERTQWEWMLDDFDSSTCVTAIGSARYTSASWNINRLAEWGRIKDSLGNYPISIYESAEGPSDETFLTYMDWRDFRRRYLRGSQQNQRPLVYSISPANEICFGPIPDKIYRVRGEYRKSPQTLAANTDTPEMPERFHEIIAWSALMLLAGHDEAEFHVAHAASNYGDIFNDLIRDQLPSIQIGAGPIA